MDAPFEHFNISEHAARALDRILGKTTSKGRIVDVYFKLEEVLCEYCDSNVFWVKLGLNSESEL